MQRCNSEGQVLPTDSFEPGDTVEVIKGPFADFICTIHKIDADRRIWLLMEVMGGQKQVSVNTEQVRAV
jgi:transcriptional antiterminator RfaH